MPQDLQSFFVLLALSSGTVLSQLENWQWFKDTISPMARLGIQLLLSAAGAVGLVLLSANVFTPDQIKTFNQGYVMLVQVAMTIIANLGAHVVVNKLAKPAGKALQGYAASKGVGIGPKG